MKNANDYSVKVGIKLDEKSIANIKTDLESKLSSESIDIKFNTQGLSDLNTKIADVGARLDKLSSKDGFKKTDSGAKTASKSVNTLNNNLEKTTKHIKNQAFATDSWAYNWSKAMQSFLTYNTVTQFFNTVMNGIRDMIDQVKELDAALVELQKVTDLEGEALDKFVDKAYEAGETVAKTGTEMIEAATAFAKAGYDADLSLELGTVAAMYTNIADEAIDAATAADMIIAQMKAFKIEAGDAIHIIDAINEVSNNFAVSSADISRNLGKASAVMANAGNSMEQYIGLMTAATEVTRNASKAANGLKTLTLRLQGMNDEGEKDLELMAQMEGLFNKLEISVYKSNGEMKNTYEILETLAGVYQDLTNAEKAYVTETIAGKYQAQNAAAILNNWGTAVAATETAMNSAGSAANENEKVLDSIQGRLQQLSSAWEQFSTTIFDSDLIKFVIDLGTRLLKLANNDVVQGIAKLAVALAAVNMAMNVFSSAKMKIDLFTNGINKNTASLITNNLANAKLTKQTQKNVLQLLAEKGAIDKNTKSLSNKTKKELAATLSAAGLTREEKKAVFASLQQVTANGLLTISTFKLKGAWDALTAAIDANPIGAILVAVTATVSIISSLINSSQQKAEEQREKLKELNEESISKYEEAKESLEEEKESLKSLRSELADNNVTQEEAIRIKGELNDIQDKLIEKYGSEAEGIDLVNGKLEDQIDKITELERLEAKKFLTENAANFDTANTVSYKTNQFGSNVIGVTGDNEKFIDALTNNKSGWGDAFLSDYANNKTYAQWFYNQILEKIEEYNKAYNEALNAGNDDLAKKIDEKRKQLTTFSSDIKKQSEDSVKTFDEIIDAYIKSSAGLTDAYNKIKEGSNSRDVTQAYMDAIEELDKMEGANELSDEWSYNLSLYFRTLYNQYQESAEKEAEKAARDALDSYQKGALGRTESNKGSAIDVLFSNIDDKAENLQQLYEKLKEIADVEALTAEKAEDVINQFDNFNIVNGELTDSLGNSVGTLNDILYYFNAINQDTAKAGDLISTYSKSLDSITEQYKVLTSAVDEYNSAGYLSFETLQKIMDNNLLEYLSFENGQLIANTGELYNNAEAARIAASQKLYNAMADDIWAVSEGKLENASDLAKTAVANLGNESENAGNKAKVATGKFIDFAEAVDLTNKALAGKEVTSDVKKQIKAVEDAYKPYFDLLSKPINIEKKKYTGSSSSSSSSSSKEWWETALDDLKNQFNYSNINIDQYINGLEGILGKLDKGSEAWNKINQELQKQRLDKVKDDYNAGRISLSQYIKELEKLQKAYKEGTKGWNDLADAIKKAKLDELKEQQNDLKAALSAINVELQNQINNYNDLKDTAVDAIDKEIDKNKELKDSIDDNIDDYERAREAVLKYLNEQLDSLNENKDSLENYFDTITESLENMNEEQEKAVELAEAYENLVNAMSNKTKKVYKEGLGWVWEADQEAIKEARKTYEDLLKESQLKEIEDSKDKTLQTLDEQIEALENYITSWDEVLDKFENEKNKNLADLLLGENWSEAVSQLDPNIVEDFSNAYYNLQKSLEETEAEIERLNKQKDEEEEYWDNIIDKVKDYKDQWSEVANAYEEAANKQKANQLLAANWEQDILNQRLNVLEDFKNKYNRILSEIDLVNGMSTNAVSNYTPYSLPGYSNGGEVNFTGLAMLHGAPNKPEYVFNNDQIRNLLSNLTKPQYTSNINNNGNSVVNNYSIGNIELPNVQNSQQFINELKSLVNTSKNL